MPADRGFSAVALVTGANRGIGFEVTRQLAQGGLAVLLGSRDRDQGNAAAGKLAAAGDIVPIRLDVTDPGDIDHARRFVEEQFGRLDVLVNNAGTYYDANETASTIDLDYVHEAYELNVFGAWRMTQAFMPLLRRSDHPRIVNVSSAAGSFGADGGGLGGGYGAPGALTQAFMPLLRRSDHPRIVNVSSAAGSFGADGGGLGGGYGAPGALSAYGSSKAALNALTIKLAAELKDDGVLVNAVCPGYTATYEGSGGRPVEESAAGIVWAAAVADDGPTGGFFRDGEPLPW